MREFWRFCLAGGLAFLVDAGVLHAALSFGLNAYAGRVVSYLCAVSFTWWFNRTITFAGKGSERRLVEWTRYAVSQLGGGSVNYATYAALVYSVELVQRWPVLGVAAGSIGGLTINYLLARRYVFQ